MEKKKNTPKLRFPEFTGEWEEKKLGEIAEFSKGKGVSKADIAEDGKTECIRYGELYTRYNEVIKEVYSKTNLDKSNLVLSEANDVIIPASGETQIDISTASCITKSGVALGGDLNIIKTPNNGVFLSYYLNNKKKIEIASLAQGISVIHLYSSQLSLLNLKLPFLVEQTKIATFLTAVDEKLTQLKKKKTLLEQYKKGVMQKLFSQELRFKDDNNQDFPDWQEKTLGEISKITNGNGDVQDASLEAKDGWYPFYDRSEIVKYLDRYTFDGEAIIYPGEGQSFFPRYFNGKYGLHQRCYTIKDYCANIHGKYLYYYLSTQNNYFIAFAVGSTVPSLRLDTFQQAKVLLPSLVEQQKIATFLSAIDEKISHSSAQIEKMEAWKKGLLQQMFC